MNTFTKYVSIIVAFAFMVFVILKITEKPIPVPFIDNLKSENKIIEVLSDSLLEVNRKLREEVMLYELKVDSFESVIKNKDKQIGKLKTAENEKLHTIDSLNANGLVELFSGTVRR